MIKEISNEDLKLADIPSLESIEKIKKDKEEGLSQIDDNEKEDILKLLIYYKVRFI